MIVAPRLAISPAAHAAINEGEHHATVYYHRGVERYGSADHPR
jgi:hypothetical protein